MPTISVVNRRTYSRPRGSTALDHYIGRPSDLGNPFIIDRDGTRDEVVTLYKDWLQTKLNLPGGSPQLQEITLLAQRYNQGQDINLICWCAPEACHGFVVKKAIILVAERLLNEPTDIPRHKG